ncbi:hypothetical protein OSB04_007860 [Centaurea solstitialis]|uniref:UBZ4-type domain-containing protein n=1 Tax=Centaurea solstitialis TaxID=347529 RepID=A0AA38WR34_9ASTR|nr:hypothetical protein OSB04_007860 [Centaurea solstitialis]
MISIDDHPPPDPSSSSHHHNLKINSDDQKASVSVSDLDLKCSDADLDNPLPNFSIRDHVFGLRSKDVARNWPFSSRSLQICLRNGVKNLLPPFQPLDSRRDTNSSRCDLETHLDQNEEIVNGLDGKPMEDRSQHVVSDAAKSLREPLVSVNSSGSKENKESNPRPVTKKGRSVTKPNFGIEPAVQTDTGPNSFIVSETMASKVCPVCKIFSSSSNTTLNAHIDQCLTGEASMKWTDNPKVIVKHRIKPRKTRLMVDIYETAPRCTIEELDRRNGTSWATNSSFPAQEIRFQEEKEEPILTANVTPEVADNEGDVYIDTDGTKVRILSVPMKAGSSENNGNQKLLKRVKGGKIVIGKKKNSLFKAKNHQKLLKLGLNARKLGSSKPSHRDSEIVDKQIRSSEKELASMAESCGIEEGGREPMKSPAGLTIVRPPWACSKRTRLGKKLTVKRQNLGLQNDPRKVVAESEDPLQTRKKMRTHSPLTGQTGSNLSRKTNTFSADDITGSQDSYPSRSSDSDPDIGINRKFSSNLKRKFSTFEKSQDRCLSIEKSGPSRGSSRDESRSEEEHTSGKSSNDESSVGIETAIEDGLHDVESVRNRNLPNDEINDRDRVIPATRMVNDDEGLMDLSNSFDPEFSKLVDDHPNGKNIFGNDIEDGTEDVEKNQDYFDEVDPIPIPGPPGSFLPSPGGDTISEEIQPIQPIRVPPIENPHNLDTIDRDSMSNSPVSTVSNPSMARSDSRSSEKLSYRSNSVQDDPRPGFSIEPVFKKGVTNGGDDWIPEKGPSPAGFKTDQPCCCSRKETVSSYSVASSYQDSFSLRKQPPIELTRNPNPNGLTNFRSDSMFLINNHPISQPPETPIFSPVAKNSTTVCDSAANPSKPVLRLMGKNLTVVKTDDDFRPPMSQLVHRPVIFNEFMAVDRNSGPMVPPVRSRYGYDGLDSRPNPSPVKEIIIIDDSSPEIEARDDSIRNEFLKRNQMNPFYGMYQSQSSDRFSYGGGPAMFRGGSFQTSSGMIMHMGSSSSSSSLSSSSSNSMSHLRSSSAYYPPSYP